MNSLVAVQAAITIINSLIVLGNNSEKFRQLVANAIAEGRNISAKELDSLAESAYKAIDEARDND